jgi:hypothetical protein
MVMRTPRASFPKPLLVVALAVAPRCAFAWSANGHKTVALIAESRLSDAAKQGVAAILGPTATLDAIAPCADDIRGKTGYDCAGITLNDDPQSEPWHFVDAPISDSPGDGAALEAYCPNQACVIDQVNKNVAVLKAGGAQADMQVALMFLVHFVGDEHQPLHCSNEIVGGVNDRGGNLKSVNFNGTSLNLHALWDHQIQSGDVNDPAQTSQRLIADLQGKDVSGWTSGDFVSQAAFESFTIAKQTVYPAFYAQDAKTLGATYQAQMQPIVDERLERAGVRLAALLESALGPATARASSAGAGSPSAEKARTARSRAAGAMGATPP